MKQVIHIFGASGSGTSTLGREICARLGYTFLDTDDYFWMPADPKFTQKRPMPERVDRMIADITRSDHAVISGSLTDWGDVLIPYFTLAVRLEMDPELRIARLRQRENDRFGTRIAPGGDMYQKHLDFIAWAKTYDTGGPEHRSKAKHDAWQTLLSCPILQLDGAAPVDALFLQVKQALDLQTFPK